jgi:hypothetical protein
MDLAQELKAKMTAAARQRDLQRKRERRAWARKHIEVTKRLHGRCVVYALHRTTVAGGSPPAHDDRPLSA